MSIPIRVLLLTTAGVFGPPVMAPERGRAPMRARGRPGPRDGSDRTPGQLAEARVGEGGAVHLWLGEIATLPEQTAFLAGGYMGVCSALLVSRDGGKTWRRSGPAFARSIIAHLRTVGVRHIWGIAIWTVEGCNTPQSIIASQDAGRSWSVIPIDFTSLKGLYGVSGFTFHDAKHGLLTLSGSTDGRAEVHYTEDGGKTWRLLYRTRRRPQVETGCIDPTAPRSLPLAPLWEKREDFHKITAALRMRRSEDGVIIEMLRYYGAESPKWTERARIPLEYKVVGERLVPTREGTRPVSGRSYGVSPAGGSSR